MKKYIGTSILIFFSYYSFSQAYITLVNNNTASFYTSLDSAVYYASDGDYIYIPGGTFPTNDIVISKQVHIVGAGHYPDSSSATGRTILGGNIKLIDGADGTSLEGFYLTGRFYLGTNISNHDVDNISVLRCNIYQVYLSYNGSSQTNAQNISFSECIIRREPYSDRVSIYGGSAYNVIFTKCIIDGVIKYFANNAVFKNTIFLFTYDSQSRSVFGYDDYNMVNSSLFENCIIRHFTYPLEHGATNYDYNIRSSSFNNNFFVHNQGFPSGTNIGTNNMVNISHDAIFVNQSGGAFNYDHDYHLQPNSPGINAGTDGTNIGIYGTSNPYKEGAVPSNPHIQSKSIIVQDNQISIDINVKAQNQ